MKPSEVAHFRTPWKLVEPEVMEDGSVYPMHIVTEDGEYSIVTFSSMNGLTQSTKDALLFRERQIAEFVIAAATKFTAEEAGQ